MYYMTVDELKAILPSVFTSNELLDIGLGNLTPGDIEVILARSEDFIDNLRYKGEFLEKYQSHAFPRKLNTGYVVNKSDDRVQKALCSIFYDILKSKGNSRKDLIKQGVKSISVAGVSESYGSIDEIKEVSDNYVKYLGFCLFNGIL